MTVLPNGADKILALRKRGQKPAEMLIVSLIGPTREANHHVFADPDGLYDWRWIVGLDACIFMRPGVLWKPIALAVAMAKPHWLGVYDATRFVGADVCALPFDEDIEKPAALWRWKLDFLPWLPFQNHHFAFSD